MWEAFVIWVQKIPMDFKKVGLFLCYAEGKLIDIIKTRSSLRLFRKGVDRNGKRSKNR